jgi:hypothetical protein
MRPGIGLESSRLFCAIVSSRRTESIRTLRVRKMRFTLIKVIFATIAVLALAACSIRARLTLTPDSTPEHMTFSLSAWWDSTPGRLQDVSVHRCVNRGSTFPESGEVVWSASLADGAQAPLVGRFGYGQQLSGFTTSHEPVPLGPGCYIVRAYATFPDTRQGVLVVRVSSAGQITTDA